MPETSKTKLPELSEEPRKLPFLPQMTHRIAPSSVPEQDNVTDTQADDVDLPESTIGHTQLPMLPTNTPRGADMSDMIGPDMTSDDDGEGQIDTPTLNYQGPSYSLQLPGPLTSPRASPPAARQFYQHFRL